MSSSCFCRSGGRGQWQQWERPGNLGSFEDSGVIPAECLGARVGGVGSVKVEKERRHPARMGPELPGGKAWILDFGKFGKRVLLVKAPGKEMLGGRQVTFTRSRAREGAGVSVDTRLSLWTSQARAKVRHAMQFPKELTQKACMSRCNRQLRLICIYFSTNRFFQVSTTVSPGGRVLAPSWGHCRQLGHRHGSGWGPASVDQPTVQPEPPLPLSSPQL